MLIVLSLVMLIVIAALLIWSSIRAWRQENVFLKWGGTGLAALLAAVVSLASVLTAYLRSERQARQYRQHHGTA